MESKVLDLPIGDNGRRKGNKYHANTIDEGSLIPSDPR